MKNISFNDNQHLYKVIIKETKIERQQHEMNLKNEMNKTMYAV